jgi:hypothetical protein
MVIRGEPDPASASIDDWIAYREHLKSLGDGDESIRLALAIAQAQIHKLAGERDVSKADTAVR